MAIALRLLAMSASFTPTRSLVLNSCPPFTASVLSAESRPAFTPDSARAPSVPAIDIDVPSDACATVIARLAASCCTSPMLPSFRLLTILVRLLLSELTPVSSSAIASPTLPAVWPCTLKLGPTKSPVALTCAPPPRLAATPRRLAPFLMTPAVLVAMLRLFVAIALRLLAMSASFTPTRSLVLNSCPPFTASVLSAESRPAFTPDSARAPSVPAIDIDVPSDACATVIARLAASCCTSPMLPSFRLLTILVRLLLSELTPVSSSAIASPTLPAVWPCTLKLGPTKSPVALTCAPPPRLAATPRRLAPFLMTPAVLVAILAVLIEIKAPLLAIFALFKVMSDLLLEILFWFARISYLTACN